MPEVSRFYGIVIKLHYRDHAPPHFHAEYGSDEMTVEIDPLQEMAGYLLRRAVGMVLDWAAMHQAELAAAWQAARANLPLPQIDPLP